MGIDIAGDFLAGAFFLATALVRALLAPADLPDDFALVVLFFFVGVFLPIGMFFGMGICMGGGCGVCCARTFRDVDGDMTANAKAQRITARLDSRNIVIPKLIVCVAALTGADTVRTRE
ncbi:MAG: hypothetical protein ABR585_10800 [Gemmatimonadaceae bacterium]